MAAYWVIEGYSGDGPAHLIRAPESPAEWSAAPKSLCGQLPPGDWSCANERLTRVFLKLYPERVCPDCLAARG